VYLTNKTIIIVVVVEGNNRFLTNEIQEKPITGESSIAGVTAVNLFICLFPIFYFTFGFQFVTFDRPSLETFLTFHF
jgi:hypothetical protein